ncbi:MAG: hypothetical protein E3J87_09090 [Candidatus Cloacimonadota bacterium]|nr:MAG: hypothetical protein E3J87_09090 [Candidatus Cloacimonadota bacterium]
MCSFVKGKFGINFWNLAFFMLVTLFLLFPIFSDGNLLNLNKNLSFMKNENSKEDTSIIKDSSFWKSSEASKERLKKIDVGIGYSIGVSTGPNLGMSGGNGLFNLDPAYCFPNLIEIAVQYNTSPRYLVSSRYVVELTSGYMWISAGRREPNIQEPDWRYVRGEWRVSIIPIKFSIQKVWKDKFLGVGIGYYFSRGRDTEEAYEGIPIADTMKHVTVTSWGRGFGYNFIVGLERPTFNNCDLTISLILNFTVINETKNDAPDNLIWKQPIRISLSGLYLSFEIKYPIFQ